MAIILSASSVWAEERSTVLPTFSNTTVELNIPLHSNPASEDYAIANYAIDFDQAISNKEANSLPTQDLSELDTLKTPVRSAEALKLPQSTEPFEATEPVSIERIAQADAPLDAPAQDAPTQPAQIPSQSSDAPPETAPPETAPTPDTPTPDVPSTQPSESASSPASSNRWQFSAEPYFFVPLDVHADVTVLGRKTSLNLGLDDILHLNRAFDAGLRLQAQNNRWGVILDGFYLYAEDSGNLGRTFSSGSIFQFVQRTSPGRLGEFTQRFEPQQLQRFAQIGRQIGLNTPVRVSADGTVAVRQITVDTAVSYRAVDTSLSHSPEANFYPRLRVAPIIGVRTNFLKQTVEVETIRINDQSIPDRALPQIDRNFRFSRTLVDPLVGAQIDFALSERWLLGLRGDVSGFNIGAKQNFTWNLIVGTQYNITRNVALQLAYRFNGFDFETGEGLRRTELNLRQNGIWLSGIFQF